MEIRKLSLDFLQKNIKGFIQVVKGDSPYYWTEQQLILDLPCKWEYSFYVVEESEIIGYAICSQKNEYIHLHHLMIKEKYQSRGIGLSLINMVMKRLKEKHSNELKGLSLKVGPDNIRAFNFYKKHGFKVIGIEDDGDLLMLLEK
ncbi:GNAT family N-acetyltransferase [Halalkalibacter lacteus]|uniref:GNAT family N-acetyltransferase n=1 Tax=Halalkalibacter lacteus TaxID=3090663 RepID=UPI002FC927A3